MTNLIGAAVAALAVILLAGALYQQRGLAKDQRRFPVPGRFIDVGGRRLHLDVRGQGSPTVVFEAGIAATSLSWSLVQPEIARMTATASYDRAWLGWSDASPGPRDLEHVIRDFEALVERAPIATPFILVAHSYGTLIARAYQARHPANVAGLVLADPMATAEWNPPSATLEQRLRRGIRLSRRGARLARIGVVRIALGLLQAGRRLGLAKLIARASSGRDSSFIDRIVGQVIKLPAESWPLIQAHWSDPKCFEGMARYLEGLPESASAASRIAGPEHLHGARLIVLSAEGAAPYERAEHEALAEAAGAHAVIVPASGHWIQMDRPDTVIAAIRDLVMRARMG